MKKHNLQSTSKDNNGSEKMLIYKTELEVEMNVDKEKDAKLSTILTQNQNQQNAQKNSKISPPLGRKIFKVNSKFFQYNL